MHTNQHSEIRDWQLNIIMMSAEMDGQLKSLQYLLQYGGVTLIEL